MLLRTVLLESPNYFEEGELPKTANLSAPDVQLGAQERGDVALMRSQQGGRRHALLCLAELKVTPSSHDGH